MSVSHSGTQVQVTFCDLLKYFQGPTGVRESFFSRLAVSGDLSPSAMLQKGVQSCVSTPAKHGILGILSPRVYLSEGKGKLNVPAVWDITFSPLLLLLG